VDQIQWLAMVASSGAEQKIRNSTLIFVDSPVSRAWVHVASIKKFRSSGECQAGGSKSLKRLQQAQRAVKMLGFSRKQRLQVLGVRFLSLKPVLKRLPVRLERMTEEQLSSLTRRSSLGNEDTCRDGERPS